MTGNWFGLKSPRRSVTVWTEEKGVFIVKPLFWRGLTLKISKSRTIIIMYMYSNYCYTLTTSLLRNISSPRTLFLASPEEWLHVKNLINKKQINKQTNCN